MQSPAHFLIGGAICRQVRCKPLGLMLALASHFALDALPHFEDPSILPRSISGWAGHHWGALLAAAQVSVGLLAIAVWWRWRAHEGSGVGEVMYVIAGGLIACAPDYLHWIAGLNTVVNELNRGSHRWWFDPYLHYVRTYLQNRPWVAVWCLTVESGVCLAGALGLFANLQKHPRPADDAAGEG
jgi:hypothetical protein